MNRFLICLVAALSAANIGVAARVNAWGDSSDDYIAIKTGATTELVIPTVVIDAAVSNTVPTTYTPAMEGQILTGKLLATNTIWIAAGTTTNDWVALN